MDMEMTKLPIEEAFKDVITVHRNWLESFRDPQRSYRWNQLLVHQPESAIVEAAVREVLQSRVEFVEPFESLSDGGPDYLCRLGVRRFYVECACLTKAMVERETNLPDGADGQARYYRHLTARVLRLCQQKESQCGRVNGAPCLLALGTLHFLASVMCFGERGAELMLMSEPAVHLGFDQNAGELVGEPRVLTNLRSAAFVRPATAGKAPVEPARSAISGLLLLGLGCLPPKIHGALHPSALRPFARDVLADIPFCRLAVGWEQGRMEVEWC